MTNRNCSLAELNWFAIQAKPHQEELASARVANLKIEVFFPRIKRCKSVCGVSRMVVQALFQGYFFARFVPTVSVDLVRHCYGVFRIVGTPQFPLPVEPEILSSIRERMQPDGLVEIETARFRPGDSVRIEQGPFEGFMAEVEREIDDGKRVAVLLEAIQQARLVLKTQWLAPAEPV